MNRWVERTRCRFGLFGHETGEKRGGGEVGIGYRGWEGMVFKASTVGERLRLGRVFECYACYACYAMLWYGKGDVVLEKDFERRLCCAVWDLKRECRDVVDTDLIPTPLPAIYRTSVSQPLSNLKILEAE